MKLFRGNQPLPSSIKAAAATIGNFDGVHRGHQSLLALLRARADELGLPVLVVLFEPQPSEYFKGEQAPVRLTSLREKLNVLQQCGVDYVYCLKFDKKLARLDPEEFAETYLFQRLRIKFLLLGQDFRFGSNRLGDNTLLHHLAKRWSCTVSIFPNFSLIKERVSSTKVRQTLVKSELSLAAELLGRTYSVCGRVTRGAGRGRQWGIPTANLMLHRLKLPLSGVFCVLVKRFKNAELLPAVANVGTRPTVDGTKHVLEVHLLNMNECLYGEMLQLYFLHKLRDEVKFLTVDSLIDQIKKDIYATKQYFDNSATLPKVVDISDNPLNDFRVETNDRI